MYPTRKIYPELVPESAWHKNLRSELSEADWNTLKKYFGKLSGYKCAITGTVGPKWPVELHEHWEYDDENGIQMLSGLSMLAPDVHLCMHPGFAESIGKLSQVKNTMVFWNSKIIKGYNLTSADKDLRDAFSVWRERSLRNWKLDISLLKTLPVNLEKKF